MRIPRYSGPDLHEMRNKQSRFLRSGSDEPDAPATAGATTASGAPMGRKEANITPNVKSAGRRGRQSAIVAQDDKSVARQVTQGHEVTNAGHQWPPCSNALDLPNRQFDSPITPTYVAVIAALLSLCSTSLSRRHSRRLCDGTPSSWRDAV